MRFAELTQLYQTKVHEALVRRSRTPKEDYLTFSQLLGAEALAKATSTPGHQRALVER